MNTPKRARIVAGSSSSYSLRERPEQENLFKSKSSVYSLRKTENRGIPVAGRSSLFTPQIDKTLIKKKNRGRSVAAGLSSSYSLRERPKENDGTNREKENVSGSKMVRVPELIEDRVSESLNDDVPQPMEVNISEPDDVSNREKESVSESVEHDVPQPLAANSSSSYSSRERPKQKKLFKSMSSFYSLRKTENRGRTVAGPSSLFTPHIDKTLIKKKNRGRTVVAGLSSSYSLRERPKENNGTNRENVSGSKIVRVPEPIEDRVSESLNDDVPQPMEVNVSEPDDVSKREKESVSESIEHDVPQPLAANSSSSYSPRERPKQQNLFKSMSSFYSLRKTENRGRTVAGPSSLFTPKIDKTLIKKINRGRTVAAGLSSSYSLRGRPKKNDGTIGEKDNLSGSKKPYVLESMEDVSESAKDDLPPPLAAGSSFSHSRRGRPKKNNGTNREKESVSESAKDDLPPHLAAGSSFSHSRRGRPKKNNGTNREKENVSESLNDDVPQPVEVNVSKPDDVLNCDKESVSETVKDDVLQPLAASSSLRRGRPKKNNGTNREKESVSRSKKVHVSQPIEDHVSESVNDAVPQPMEVNVSKPNDVLNCEKESISELTEDDVSQSMEDRVSESVNDDVPQLMEVNVSKSKKDNGTTQPLLPKLKRFDINELRALTLENDRRRLKYSQRIHVLETEAIQDDYRIKNLAVKTANCSDRSAFNDPYDVNFEIQERDRIFSGTSASFQPKNIFESSDDEESEAN